ncbi:MAG: sigma-70 family RNA polymerase sigma factor [Deltaproteobacteria bacterium]|nr:sigma-70 family RNA polymerase sigma factor [Deltaproteobacteria bacterium]
MGRGRQIRSLGERPEAGEITGLLQDWAEGNEETHTQLMELIYGELCRLASSRLRQERSDHTLQTSALVHEAYLRLLGQKQVSWQDRGHFFAMAARMMRRILVNHARDRVCAKRGGGVEHLPLEESVCLPMDRPEECIAVDEALGALAAVHPQQAKVVELRYFGGLNRDEIGESLGLSRPTIARRLRVARIWLYRYLHGES